MHLHYISIACIILLAAAIKNNETLKMYHSGAYGSLQPDEWSCCKRKGQEQIGCISTADITSIPDSMEERLRERRLSPPQPIPRKRGGVQSQFNVTIKSFDHTIFHKY